MICVSIKLIRILFPQNLEPFVSLVYFFVPMSVSCINCRDSQLLGNTTGPDIDNIYIYIYIYIQILCFIEWYVWEIMLNQDTHHSHSWTDSRLHKKMFSTSLQYRDQFWIVEIMTCLKTNVVPMLMICVIQKKRLYWS